MVKPKAPLLVASPNEAIVTVEVVSVVPVFVGDCTIAPDPFVPDVSMPATSKIIQAVEVAPVAVIVTAAAEPYVAW